MVSEIDWMSINVQLSRLLGISLSHFNQIETAIFAAYNFDVGISGEHFKARFAQLDQVCKDKHEADIKDRARIDHEDVMEESRSEGELATSKPSAEPEEDEKTAVAQAESDSESSQETKLSSESR